MRATIRPDQVNRPSQETFYVQFPYPIRGWAHFYVVQGVVDSVVIGNDAAATQFTLRELITQYGPPETILLNTDPFFPAPSIPFFLALLYEDHRFFAIYDFAARILDSNVVACPGTAAPLLVILPPDISAEAGVHAYFSGEGPSPPLLPIEEVTRIDAPTFASLFLEEGSDPCIESPIDSW
jgi:hypothetical protein